LKNRPPGDIIISLWKKEQGESALENYIDFDYINRIDKNLAYGIIKGDERILFIKPGLGSDFLGDNDKYLIMAYRLNEEFGCSVIVSSNPHDGKSHGEEDMSIINEFVREMEFQEPKILLFGYSNGAIKGLELTSLGLKIERGVLVNMPLMINFHRTKKYVCQNYRTKFTAVYGEKDPSFPYIPFIKGRFSNLEVLEIPGADHNFYGMAEQFFELARSLLSEKAK
jgi:hypothetical protein